MSHIIPFLPDPVHLRGGSDNDMEITEYDSDTSMPDAPDDPDNIDWE
jgi:hypothetical protein